MHRHKEDFPTNAWGNIYKYNINVIVYDNKFIFHLLICWFIVLVVVGEPILRKLLALFRFRCQISNPPYEPCQFDNLEAKHSLFKKKNMKTLKFIE
jgi:hypothetical protein